MWGWPAGLGLVPLGTDLLLDGLDLLLEVGGQLLGFEACD